VRDVVTDMVKCADIQDPPKRLECFDAAAVRARGALAAPPPPPPQTKEKSLMDWFGFSKSPPVTRPEDFGKAPEPGPNEVTQVSSNVLEFAKTVRGKAVFILENGQVWRQIEGDSTVVQPPAPGTTMKVTIETGFLSSYNLTILGQGGIIKVNRLK
jgi:hypothetical protein